MSAISPLLCQLPQPPNASVATSQNATHLHEQTIMLPRKMICKVCGGKAIGERYGVLSCGGCASFFSHRKAKPLIGQCKKSEECPKRLRCVACRMQKCLAAGMSFQNCAYQYPSPSPDITGNYKSSSSSSASELSQPTSSSVFKTCAVCGKNAIGFRYGVPACGNCKDFFGKTNKKQPIGDCIKGGNCQLNQRCTPCRFQKCLRAGMGKKKEADIPSISTGQAIVVKILAAHSEICEYTEDKMKKMVVKEYPWTPDKNTPQMTNRLYAWKAYSMQMERDIKSTGYFIRTLKDKLSFEDRAELFKKKFFQMHMVRITRALCGSGLLLVDGRLIDAEFFKALYGEELAEEMITFANQALNIFKLDDDGFAMLLAMSFYSDNDSNLHNIADPEALENVSQDYRRHFIEWCDNKKAPRTFRNIQLMLNKLQRLDTLFSRDVANILKLNAEHFNQKTLFAEVYLK